MTPLARPALLLALAAAAARAGNVALFPGGAYDPASGAGYLDAPSSNGTDDAPLNPPPGASAGNGVAVGVVQKYGPGSASQGRFAARWGPAVGGGFAELGQTGTTAQNNAFALATNAGGTAVGYGAWSGVGAAGGGYRALRWEAGATAPTLLDDLAASPAHNVGRGSYAQAVNDSGTAVGYGRKTVGGMTYGTRAVRWEAGGAAATELGALGTDPFGQTRGQARAVNDAGTAVGFMRRYDASGAARGQGAVRWDAGSATAVELDALPGSASSPPLSSAEAINDLGVVVGSSSVVDASGNYVGSRPVRWAAGGTAVTRLGVAGLDAFYSSPSASAVDVNAAGDAVGYLLTPAAPGGGFRALRWSAGDDAGVELGNLGFTAGLYSSRAHAINALGWTAGTITDVAHEGPVAVLWSPAGVAVDLDARRPPGDGWEGLVDLTGLTDAGWASGYGHFDADGPDGAAPYRRGFLMLVPEAGTYGLGDADFDGDVDFADLARLAANYGAASGGSTDVADLDLDGDVDFTDLARLAANYGGPSNVGALGEAFASDFALALASVPEPAALALVAPALLGLRRVRSRHAGEPDDAVPPSPSGRGRG